MIGLLKSPEELPRRTYQSERDRKQFRQYKGIFWFYSTVVVTNQANICTSIVDAHVENVLCIAYNSGRNTGNWHMVIIQSSIHNSNRFRWHSKLNDFVLKG